MPRRAGKDVFAFNLMIRSAIKKVGVYYYIFPTFAQAKRVIWDSITNDGQRFLDYIPEALIESKNSQELKIRLKNGSLIALVGSDNYDALMGSNPRGCVFSEYALQDPRAYQYIRPILLANDGWAIFISTPRGKNHLYDLFNIAKELPSWFVWRLTVDETKHISREAIERERIEGLISEDLIQQEYYCFPAGQQVLTSLGSKSIEAINPNDLVVSHSGRLRKVIDTISREYSGSLYQIHSYGCSDPIICTPEHPIRVYDHSSQKYTWKAAKDIDTDDRLVFPKMTLGYYDITSYEMCMLIAWYITEGSCFKNGAQWTVKHEEALRIKQLLVVLGFGFEEYKKDSVTNVVCNSVQLVDFFKATCGTEANDKRIPFHLIMGHEDEFFHELIKGDGCHNISNGHEKYCYSTVSQSLAYQVQLLANSLNVGYASGISVREPYEGSIEGRSVNCQRSYQINISFPGLRQSGGKLMRAKNCIAAKITQIILVPKFEGRVYNLKVQYDESYLVSGRAVHNCSFDLGVEGAYYIKYMDRNRIHGQISNVPWQPMFKVHTAWDIGVRDSTAIIFFQQVGTNIHIIDCYERSKEGLEHYIQVLASKSYKYGHHIGPHDLAVQEFGSGITRVEKARQLGIEFTIASDHSIMDGIEAVRSTLPRVYIDESNCKTLIKALENYRQEYDSKRKVYKQNPLHDIHSHFADSMRYLCVSLPKTRDGMSQEDVDRLREQAYYGEKANMPRFFSGEFDEDRPI